MRFLSDARPPAGVARPAPDAASPLGLARPLTIAEQQALLHYAREAVTDAVTRGDLPRILRNDGIFAERCGVFVTLHILQRLRGCIGVVETDEPLGSSLVRCAASAALSDPRFPPVRQDELPHLRIEISLLSPPEPIRPECIEIGRHGLLVVSSPSPRRAEMGNDGPPVVSSATPRAEIGSDGLAVVSSRTRSRVERERCEGPAVSSGGSSSPPISNFQSPVSKRGLLLPQVAVEHQLTPEQFLAETCRKAGLPPEAWRQLAEASGSASPPDDACRALPDDAYRALTEHTYRVQLFAFTCQVFSEL